MNHLKKIAGTCLLLLIAASHLMSQNLVIAAGAGYKKPVTEVTSAFEDSTGIKTDAIFGNIQMVAGQAKQTGEISCIIGDKKFLERIESIVSFSDYYPIGKGILVLAFRKGVEIFSPEDLLTEKVHSVFMPQEGKAIYGIAGSEALKSYGYTAMLANKLTQVATVPQVISYLLTGEADAGFINLTETLANQDKLGGFLIIPDDQYSEITIVAGVVTDFKDKPETLRFIDFLQSDQAKAIFEKFGLR